MKRQPEIRRRSYDGLWQVWTQKRHPDFQGQDLKQLPPWVFSTQQWVPTGVFSTRHEALKAIGKAR